MRKDITMRDIAEKVGVSIVTISKALKDKDGVGNDLRIEIKRVADQLGYSYQSNTKSEEEKKRYHIGVIVEEHFVGGGSYPFYLKMYQSIVIELSKFGYLGILEVIQPEMLRIKKMPNMVSHQNVDGLIVLGKVETDYLKQVREYEIPMVYLDFYERETDVPSVITDNVYGSYLITSYLIEMGHRHIAFVGSTLATSSILDRYLGYYRALMINQIVPREDYIIPDRGEDGLFTELELPKEMPSAFVCNCDEIAYILMEKLGRLGYRIPEDISVVGFDNYSFAGYATPKLTTIEVNMDAMTQTVVELLVRMIEGEKHISGRKVICGTLLLGDSVGKHKNS